MVLFLEASTWESGECWTAVCRCSNISLQLMRSSYETVIRLLGAQNTVWVEQEMLLIPILQWKQLPFCCKQSQISSSFVLNGTVNCIASLNTRHLHQHAHQLAAKKLLKWMKITIIWSCWQLQLYWITSQPPFSQHLPAGRCDSIVKATFRGHQSKSRCVIIL